MVFILIGGFALLLDLGIKELIQGLDEKELPMEIKKTKGMVYLYNNRNAGLPFGFLKEYPQLVRYLPLSILSAVAGIFLWMLSKKGFWLEKIALALTLGGGLSNLYDRIKRHYVVDYLNIRWGFLKKVIFNLGDFFILIGFALMTIKEIYNTLKR